MSRKDVIGCAAEGVKLKMIRPARGAHWIQVVAGHGGQRVPWELPGDVLREMPMAAEALGACDDLHMA